MHSHKIPHALLHGHSQKIPRAFIHIRSHKIPHALLHGHSRKTPRAFIHVLSHKFHVHLCTCKETYFFEQDNAMDLKEY